MISSYYPSFSSTADLTNIQRVLDDIPPFEDSAYKAIVKEYASQLSTYLYVAVAEDPNDDKSKHYEKLASMFKEYRDQGHLNLGITLGFYKKSFKNLDKYLGSFEKLVIISKND